MNNIKPLWLRRLSIVMATMAVALIIREIAIHIFGIRFVSSGGELGHDHLEITVRAVLDVSGTAALLGWLAIAILERITKLAKSIWTIGAVGAWTAATIPLFPWPMHGDVRFTLVLMHTAVAATFIALIRQTVRTKAVAAPPVEEDLAIAS